MSEFALLTGNRARYAGYRELSKIKEAYNTVYFDIDSAKYDNTRLLLIYCPCG